jgi:hypothetical protein
LAQLSGEEKSMFFPNGFEQNLNAVHVFFESMIKKYRGNAYDDQELHRTKGSAPYDLK